MNILVVEDSPQKMDQVVAYLDDIDSGFNVSTATNVVDAIGLLKQVRFSLVVLDVVIPFDLDEEACPTNCERFLKLVTRSRLLHQPFLILLTEKLDQFEIVKDDLARFGWVTFEYAAGGAWQLPFRNVVVTIAKNAASSPEFDVAWIVALRDSEFAAVRSLDLGWQEFALEGDANVYYKCVVSVGDEEISIVLGCAHYMGQVGAAEITSRMLRSFRPRMVVMSGITGGIEGKCNMGDLIVADSVFDFGSGKLLENDAGSYLDPAPNDIPCDFALADCISRFIEKGDWLKEIKLRLPDEPKIEKTALRFAPVASGANVIGSPVVVSQIKTRNRKVVGIEMEAYPVFHCCRSSLYPAVPAFVCKGVTDFADLHKGDKFRMRCSLASALATLEFCKYWVTAESSLAKIK